MQFNSNNNNNREANNVNTRGVQFMNSEGFYPSTMLLGYWNEMITIKIHPALEKSQQTQSKVFNYEKQINTAVTLEKSITLAEAIDDVIKGNKKFRGIPVGGTSLLGVGRRDVEGDIPVYYFAIFKGLNEETKKPETSIYYEFKNSYTIDDYDAETGGFTLTQGIPSELLMFVEILRAARTGLSNSVAHATRVVDKYYRDRLQQQLDEIGAKLGIEKSSRGSFGGAGSFRSKDKDLFSGGSGFGGEKGSDLGGSFEANTSKLSNLNDIEQFMG